MNVLIAGEYNYLLIAISIALSFTWLKHIAAIISSSSMVAIHNTGMNAMNFYTTESYIGK